MVQHATKTRFYNKFQGALGFEQLLAKWPLPLTDDVLVSQNAGCRETSRASVETQAIGGRFCLVLPWFCHVSDDFVQNQTRTPKGMLFKCFLLL